MDAAQNHYVTFGVVSPMVFLGTHYWTREKPVYPLLTALAAGDVTITATRLKKSSSSYSSLSECKADEPSVAGAALSLKSQRKPTVARGSRVPLRPGDRPLSACGFPENHAAGRHGLQPDRASGSLARCGSRFPLRLRLNEGSTEKGVGARGIGLEATRAPREVPGQDEAASTTREREEAHRQGARLQEPRS